MNKQNLSGYPALYDFVHKLNSVTVGYSVNVGTYIDPIPTDDCVLYRKRKIQNPKMIKKPNTAETWVWEAGKKYFF